MTIYKILLEEITRLFLESEISYSVYKKYVEYIDILKDKSDDSIKNNIFY